MLARIDKVSDHTKCMSSNNDWCIATPNIIDLNSSELHYDPLMGSLDRYHRSCKTLHDLSIKICVLN